MPTQEYSCPRDGAFDVYLSFKDEVARETTCPTCGVVSAHVLRAPAGIKIKGTWNDEANEMRRDPYTQAKYQATHAYNEQKDAGIDAPKVTEAGLQAVAKAIAADNKKVKKTTAQRSADFARGIR